MYHLFQNQIRKKEEKNEIKEAKLYIKMANK